MFLQLASDVWWQAGLWESFCSSFKVASSWDRGEVGWCLFSMHDVLVLTPNSI